MPYYEVDPEKIPMGERHHSHTLGREITGGEVIQIPTMLAVQVNFLKKTGRRGPRLPAEPAPPTKTEPPKPEPTRSSPKKKRARRAKKS